MSSHAAPGAVVGIGPRIAAARRERGLTQKQLAETLGVSIWTLDRMETGAVDSERYVREIATVTRVRAEWLREHTMAPVAAPRRFDVPKLRAIDGVGRTIVLGSIVLLVVVRFFSEVVPVIPRAANFIDIPVLFALVIASAFAPMIRAKPDRWYLNFGVLSLLFLGICVVSAIVNSGRVAPAPVLVFIYGFLAPLGVYAATHRLWPVGNALALSRLIVVLGIIQLFVVALIDIPRFVSSRNPDDISGTFGTNGYQLVFFLLAFVSLVIGIATFEPHRAAARFAPILIVASFATVLLAQYRSLLVSMVVALVIVALLLGRRMRGIAVVAVVVTTFAGTFYYVATTLPALKLQSAASSLATDPGTYVSGRLGIFENVFHLYTSSPSTIALGSGPGTYSSRAWATFAKAKSTSRSNVAGAYAMRFTGGEVYTTDVSEKYVIPQIEGPIIEGSHAVTSPFSSYASLLAEVGVIGFVLIVGAYLVASGRAVRMTRSVLVAPGVGDPVPALSLAMVVTIVTLVQMAFLENWWETTRATFVAWMLLAVVTKEVGARRERG